jgi:hypothetical protein
VQGGCGIGGEVLDDLSCCNSSHRPVWLYVVYFPVLHPSLVLPLLRCTLEVL